MDTFLTILLGASSSLVATIVWVCVVFLYDIRARHRIRFLVEQCDSSARLLLHSVSYERYMVALSQVEKLLELLFDLNECIKPLTFEKRKRSLIKLLIYNLVRVLNIFKNLEIGYQGEQELEARCERFADKYLYEVGSPHSTPQSFMTVTISIIASLNEYRGTKRAFRKGVDLLFNRPDDRATILRSLIEVNSFRDSRSITHYMSKEAMPRRAYQRIIDKL